MQPLLLLCLMGVMPAALAQYFSGQSCGCSSISKPTSNVGTLSCPTGASCNYTLALDADCKIECAKFDGYRTRVAYRIGSSWVSGETNLYIGCNTTTLSYYSFTQTSISDPTSATCVKLATCDTCTAPTAPDSCADGYVCDASFLQQAADEYECTLATCSDGFLTATLSNGTLVSPQSLRCQSTGAWWTEDSVAVASATCKNYAACVSCTAPAALDAADASADLTQGRDTQPFEFVQGSFACARAECPAGYTLKGASESDASNSGLVYLNGLTSGGSVECNNAGVYVAGSGYSLPEDAKFLCVETEEGSSTTGSSEATTSYESSSTEGCNADFDGCAFTVSAGEDLLKSECLAGHKALSCSGGAAISVKESGASSNSSSFLRAVCVDGSSWAAVACGAFLRVAGSVEIGCATA